jgi:putative transposase
MPFHRRRLPHLHQINQPIFITWRLHGSLPANRIFPAASLTSGQAFAVMDRLLDEAKTGPTHLRQAAIAQIVVIAIHYNAEVLKHYETHAYVLMPNHVHLLITPRIPLPKLTKSLKSITAKRANQVLGLSGAPFWQNESYDHLVRSAEEFNNIRRYIENNPIKAGLAINAAELLWSSASGMNPPGAPYPAFALPTLVT